MRQISFDRTQKNTELWTAFISFAFLGTVMSFAAFQAFKESTHWVKVQQPSIESISWVKDVSINLKQSVPLKIERKAARKITKRVARRQLLPDLVTESATNIQTKIEYSDEKLFQKLYFRMNKKLAVALSTQVDQIKKEGIAHSNLDSISTDFPKEVIVEIVDPPVTTEENFFAEVEIMELLPPVLAEEDSLESLSQVVLTEEEVPQQLSTLSKQEEEPITRSIAQAESQVPENTKPASLHKNNKENFLTYWRQNFKKAKKKTLSAAQSIEVPIIPKFPTEMIEKQWHHAVEYSKNRYSKLRNHMSTQMQAYSEAANEAGQGLEGFANSFSQRLGGGLDTFNTTLSETGKSVSSYLQVAKVGPPTKKTSDSNVAKVTSIPEKPAKPVEPPAAPETRNPQVAKTEEPPEQDGVTLASVKPSTPERPSEPELPEFSEAFRWESKVEVSKTKILSTEGLAKNASTQWMYFEAEDYWPTISFVDLSAHETKAAFVSRNSVLLISKLSGVETNPSRGIIIAKHKPDLQLTFSGHADSTLKFDSENHLLKAGEIPVDANESIYTVFFNVPEGSQSVRAAIDSSAQEINFPVAKESVTFLNLNRSEQASVRGFLADASAEKFKPVKNAVVSIVGAADRIATTGTKGYFEIKNVLQVSSFPVWLDVQSVGSGTQRHKVVFEGMQNYFHFSQKILNKWLFQLSGGTNPSSGTVLAALPFLAKKGIDEFYYPSIYPVFGSESSLVPETYSISLEGQLLVKEPLEALVPRFISVQVPDGLVNSEVRDSRGELIWSHYLKSDPSVTQILYY